MTRHFRAVYACCAVLLLTTLCVACQRAGASAPAGASRIERGKYLVTLGGCHDCHTPMKLGQSGPELDMAHMLSGHPQDLAMPPAPPLQAPWGWAGAVTNTAFAGPWGVSYAANLTPDEESGLGVWTDEMFIKAMRTGRSMGAGRPILPPMPWHALGQATDEDLAAILAYLRTIPPVRNVVPKPQIAAPPAAAATS
ncbi:MAG: c-type cytochrome [Acidobacteria bacterium]|nr:c-type cytochrome [Acidobacteriota bacterium]